MYKIKLIFTALVIVSLSTCLAMEKGNVNDNLTGTARHVSVINHQKSHKFQDRQNTNNIEGKSEIKVEPTNTNKATFFNSVTAVSNYLLSGATSVGSSIYNNSAKFSNFANPVLGFVKNNSIKLGVGAACLTLALFGLKKINEKSNGSNSSKILKAVKEDPKLQVLILGGLIGAGYFGYKWYKNNSRMAKQEAEKKVDRIKIKAELEAVWRNKLSDFLSTKITYEQYNNCIEFYELISKNAQNNPKMFKDNKAVWDSLSDDQKMELDDIIDYFEEYLNYKI